MKLETLQETLNSNRTPRQMPEYVLYMPPSGAPVECPPGFDIVQAGNAASRIASRHPSMSVGVYVLAGSAFAPVVEPPFAPTSNEPFLVDAKDGDTSEEVP